MYIFQTIILSLLINFTCTFRFQFVSFVKGFFQDRFKKFNILLGLFIFWYLMVALYKVKFCCMKCGHKELKPHIRNHALNQSPLYVHNIEVSIQNKYLKHQHKHVKLNEDFRLFFLYSGTCGHLQVFIISVLTLWE